MTSVPDERRLANLRAALGFLQLPPRESDLGLLHRWLDTWTGIGPITLGPSLSRLGMVLTLPQSQSGGE